MVEPHLSALAEPDQGVHDRPDVEAKAIAQADVLQVRLANGFGFVLAHFARPVFTDPVGFVAIHRFAAVLVHGKGFVTVHGMGLVAMQRVDFMAVDGAGFVAVDIGGAVTIDVQGAIALDVLGAVVKGQQIEVFLGVEPDLLFKCAKLPAAIADNCSDLGGPVLSNCRLR